MKKLKIYLDTSAIGYLDEQTSPKEMAEMQSLWELIKQDKFETLLSNVTLDEIRGNENIEKVKVLVRFLSEISYSSINVNDDIRRIAASIKSNGLLTSDKHQNDRLHIACAVHHECDVIVSMNFKHLVNVNTIRGVRAISILECNRNIDIMSPISLIYREGDD